MVVNLVVKKVCETANLTVERMVARWVGLWVDDSGHLMAESRVYS